MEDQDQETLESISGTSETRPRQPRYLSATAVLPTQPLQAYRNAPAEHINTLWSPGHCLGGIRSLPDALDPGFRMRLFHELIQAGHREREWATAAALSGRGNGSVAGRAASDGSSPPPASSLPPSLPPPKKLSKHHPHSGNFSTFEYIPSEYDREKLLLKFEKLKGKLDQVSPLDFVVTAPPQAPKHAPGFHQFDYQGEPFELRTEFQRTGWAASKQRELHGPFLAGGRVLGSDILRAYSDECLQALCMLLSEDWPTSFSQVFEDTSGAIVVSFEREEALMVGDLSAYMTQFYKTNSAVSEYRLTRDATRWGVVDETGEAAFFVFWPPWVAYARRALPLEPLSSLPLIPTRHSPHSLSSVDCSSSVSSV